jgi:mRNA interferase MazF
MSPAGVCGWRSRVARGVPDSPDAPDKETLAAGDVISALFPVHVPGGREQQGYRPAVVVGIPERLGEPRFEVLVVVPMTTDRGQQWSERSPALCPRLAKGTAKLRSPSICLLDQVRAIGAERVRGYRGTLDAEQYRPIHDGLRRMMSYDGAAPVQTSEASG